MLAGTVYFYDENNNVIKTMDYRYKDIKKREYNYLLKLFIFKHLDEKELDELIKKSFQIYVPAPDEIENFNQFLQKRRKKEYQLQSQTFKNRLAELGFSKNNELGLKGLKKLCLEYANNLDKNLNNFREIYGKDNSQRYCGYCGVSEDQIKTLIKKNKIKTIRLSTRGKVSKLIELTLISFMILRILFYHAIGAIMQRLMNFIKKSLKK